MLSPANIVIALNGFTADFFSTRELTELQSTCSKKLRFYCEFANSVIQYKCITRRFTV